LSLISNYFTGRFKRRIRFLRVMKFIAVEPRLLHPTRRAILEEAADNPEFDDGPAYVLPSSQVHDNPARPGYDILIGHIHAYNNRKKDQIQIRVIENQRDLNVYRQQRLQEGHPAQGNPDYTQELARVKCKRDELADAQINYIHEMIITRKGEQLFGSMDKGSTRMEGALDALMARLELNEPDPSRSA
jgi:hypothetical protein